MAKNRLVAAAIVTAALALSPSAHAFCRTSSCPNVGTSQVCTPQGAGDCGTPLVWKRDCVSFSLNKDASKKVDLDTTRAIVTQAFDTWMSADCPGGGNPHIRVIELDPVDCHAQEYNKEYGNANIVLYHDDDWPYQGKSSTLALTTVSYDVDTSEIYDADIEINALVNLTTSDTAVEFDLLSILTHEAGHFLGLAHSPVAEATMFLDYVPGTTTLRDLAADDVDGICAIYPPGAAIPDSCDAEPRHGFSTDCAAVQAEGCCTIAPGSGERTRDGWPIVASMIGLVAVGLRRARGRRALR